MATEPSRKIGAMDCVVCGEVMPVRLNGRGTLNTSCPWCGHSSYVKPGTEAHRIVSGWVRKDAKAEPEQAKPVAAAKPEAGPAPEVKPAAPAAPAAKPAAKPAVKPATIFG